MEPIISPHIRVRRPEFFSVGQYSVVDDFCYFSTRVRIGRFCHIASGCSVAGGIERDFELGDYSGISSGVKIWCATDGFTNDLVTIVPAEFGEVKTHLIAGNVTFGKYTGVGTNSVILPNNHIPEGTVIGALSLVPPGFKFEPWSVYFGNPIRYALPRNKENVLAQVERIEAQLRARGEI